MKSLISRLFGKEFSEVMVTDPSRILAIAPYHLLREDELEKLLQEGVLERRKVYIHVPKNKLHAKLAKLSRELGRKFNYSFDEELLTKAIAAFRDVFFYEARSATIYYAKYLHPLLVVFEGRKSSNPVLLIAPMVEDLLIEE